MYIFIAFWRNIKGTDSSIFPYSTLFTTSGLYIFRMLFTTLENLGFSERTPSTSSPLLATSINSNYYKPINNRFCSCCTGKYSTWSEVKKLIQHLAMPRAV